MQILKQIQAQENPRKRQVYVQTLLNQLLEQEAESTSLKFISGTAELRDMDVDGLAPEGIDAWKEATAFEIKPLADTDEFASEGQIAKTRGIVDHLRNRRIPRLVVVFAFEMDQEKQALFLERLGITEIAVDIVSAGWIQDLVTRHRETALRIGENLGEIAVDSNIKRNLSDLGTHWREDTRRHISSLRDRYRQDDLVLMLGAGVSVDAGIPDWERLVTELLVSLIEKKLQDYSISIDGDQRREIIDRLKHENANSPLLQTRYIRTGLKKDFGRIFRDVLYKSCKDNSPILQALTQLSMPLRDRIGIRAIVNYNFDDLIEVNFDGAGVKYKSIFRETDLQARDALSVFHVHGYVPRDQEGDGGLAESLMRFTEEGYHNVMIDPYHWSNLVQLNFLRENTCVFIGHSMTDPNLRRLLEISMRIRSSDDCHHYAILKRNKVVSGGESQTLAVFNSVNYGIQEEVLKQLGVNIIWVERYSEIPRLLQSIRD